MYDHGVKHFEAYLDLIPFIVSSIPGRFPRETFLKDEDQWTLESAFALLQHRFHLVQERLRNASVAPRLKHLLDESLAAYRAGETQKGGHLLFEFEDLALENCGPEGPGA